MKNFIKKIWAPIKNNWKTIIKSVSMFLWICILILSIAFIEKAILKQNIKTGNNLKFNIGINDNLDIKAEADSILIEASSSDYFAFHKKNGETFSGLQSKAPISLDNSDFFTNKQTISPGEWIVDANDKVTINLTSHQNIKVKIINGNSNLNFSVVLVLGVFFIIISLIVFFSRRK